MPPLSNFKGFHSEIKTKYFSSDTKISHLHSGYHRLSMKCRFASVCEMAAFSKQEVISISNFSAFFVSFPHSFYLIEFL